MTGPAGEPPSDLCTAALAAAAGYAVARAVQSAHQAGRLPGGSGRWQRRNHEGAPVTLTEGLALTAGTILPLLVVDPPAAWVVTGSALAGAVDDLGGGDATKGLRGHLGALGRGELTTGTLKIVLLGLTGVLGAAWADRRAGRGPGPHTLAGAGLVAGGANLANLLDLRPGRALKAALACAAPLALQGRPAAAAAAGASCAVLPDDLAARSMLGDTGANPLGAAVALAAAQRLSARGRWTALGAVTALTLASERVSFTRVIEATPVLRELDRWGRG